MSDLAGYFPDASIMAGRIDALLLALTLVSVLVVGGIMAVIVWFAFRYRRGSPAARGPAPSRSRTLEVVWITVPLVVFLIIFVWAAMLYLELRSPPADALAINVVAKQWMWKVQHPGGQREINELHVPVGRPIKLVMTSQDVIHSLFVPAFRVKQDVLPGRYTTLWFEPSREGEYPLLCAEFCGTDHSGMTGRVVVMAPQDYDQWLERNPGAGTLAQQGEVVYRRHGCSGCHGESATVHAPGLAGIYGRRASLEDGGTVMVDEGYIRDSILRPASEVVAGYPPIMPSYQGQLDEEEILALVAYIRSLADREEAAP